VRSTEGVGWGSLPGWVRAEFDNEKFEFTVSSKKAAAADLGLGSEG